MNNKEAKPSNLLSEEMKRFINWNCGSDDYEKTDFKQWDVVEGLQRLAFNMSLCDEEFSFLMALYHASAGVHPKFRIQVEHPKAGSEFARVQRIKAAHEGFEIANEIDVATACGSKQEAAIQEAMEKWQLSRREIFRRLKLCREIRQGNLELSGDRANALASVPAGYDIAQDGTLVPANTNG